MATEAGTAGALEAAHRLASEAQSLAEAAIARAAELTQAGRGIDDHQVLCERLAVLATEARAAAALVGYAGRLAAAGRADAVSDDAGVRLRRRRRAPHAGAARRAPRRLRRPAGRRRRRARADPRRPGRRAAPRHRRARHRGARAQRRRPRQRRRDVDAGVRAPVRQAGDPARGGRRRAGRPHPSRRPARAGVADQAVLRARASSAAPCPKSSAAPRWAT